MFFGAHATYSWYCAAAVNAPVALIKTLEIKREAAAYGAERGGERGAFPMTHFIIDTLSFVLGPYEVGRDLIPNILSDAKAGHTIDWKCHSVTQVSGMIGRMIILLSQLHLVKAVQVLVVKRAARPLSDADLLTC